MIYQDVVELNELVTKVVNDYLDRLDYVDEVVITPESWSECTEKYSRFYVDFTDQGLDGVSIDVRGSVLRIWDEVRCLGHVYVRGLREMLEYIQDHTLTVSELTYDLSHEGDYCSTRDAVRIVTKLSGDMTYPQDKLIWYVDMPKYIEEWKNNGDI
mgnify:FL=1|jgi:hypothetical protein